MRLLVASDLHGSLPALHFLLERANELRPDLLVLLGDLVYHGPRNPLPAGYDTPQLLRTMPDLTALPCPVTAVRGNCDAEVDLALLPFPVADNAWIAVDGLRVAEAIVADFAETNTSKEIDGCGALRLSPSRDAGGEGAKR